MIGQLFSVQEPIITPLSVTRAIQIKARQVATGGGERVGGGRRNNTITRNKFTRRHPATLSSGSTFQRERGGGQIGAYLSTRRPYISSVADRPGGNIRHSSSGTLSYTTTTTPPPPAGLSLHPDTKAFLRNKPRQDLRVVR